MASGLTEGAGEERSGEPLWSTGGWAPTASAGLGRRPRPVHKWGPGGGDCGLPDKAPSHLGRGEPRGWRWEPRAWPRLLVGTQDNWGPGAGKGWAPALEHRLQNLWPSQA